MPEAAWENQVVLDGASSSWASHREAARRRLLPALTALRGRRTAFIVESSCEALETVALALSERLEILIVPKTRFTEAVRERCRAAGFQILEAGRLGPAGAESSIEDGKVWLLTSGTTGTPKLVAHSWETLRTRPKGRALPPQRWILPFQTGTYAWYQLICLGLFEEGQALIPVDGADVTGVLKAASSSKATAISATPTFWRIALLQADPALLDSISFTQITLGGEAVDQSILDAVQRAYPRAQLTHIFASSEAGACIVVKDGKAGFPAALLGAPDSKTELRVFEGRLQVRSPHTARAAAGTGDWVDTGDLVEVRGDRAFFVGRADSALINVGGGKAFPADIENALLTHPNVAWCRVRGVRAPLVGYLPEADVVLRSQASAPTAEADLVKHCGERLPPYAVPRLWNFLPAIPVSGTLKTEL